MFGSLRTAMRLSLASVVVQNLLEEWHRTGLYDFDPKALSSKLVARAYAQDEAQFNGKKGPKPHRIAVAAVALAQGMRDYDQSSDEHSACYLSIGSIMLDMERNGQNYPLTGKDRQFLSLAMLEYENHDLNSAGIYADQNLSIDGMTNAEMLPENVPPSDPKFRERMSDLQARLDAFPDRKG